MQVAKGLFLDNGGEFGAKAHAERGFMHDDHPARTLDRFQDGLDVIGNKAAQIDDLGFDAGRQGQLIGSLDGLI